MFEFRWPWLAVLVLLPLLVRLLWVRRVAPDELPDANQQTLLHPGLEHLRIAYRARRPRGSTASRVHILLLSLLWLGLTLAAMWPQWLEPHTETRAEGYDLMLAVDTSRSMTAEDFSHEGSPVSRMAVLKGVLDRFVANRVGDRVGLVLFGTQAYLLSPLTFDREALRQQLADISPGIAGDGTAIGDGLGLAVKKLRERPPGSRVLLLVTDGQNDGGRISPMEAAQLAAREGVRVYTIGVGSTQQEVRLLAPDYRQYEMATGLTIDEDLLQRIGTLTGGAYFRATDARALEEIYARIDQLEKTRAEARTVMIQHPLYYWPLAAAMLAFLLLGLFPDARMRLPRRRRDA